MTEWSKINSYLHGKSDILILIHEKPDGDCLGSALALGLALESKGYNPEILMPNKMPEIYEFLPGQHLISIKPPYLLPHDVLIIAVDCADTKRFEYRLPTNSVGVINIDHHISNTSFGDYNLVDAEAAAAGEIIYKLLHESDIKITGDIATCLYTAISSDTGSFSYSNTTYQTLQIAAELLAKGADIDSIRYNIYEKKPLKDLLIIKKGLDNLYLSPEGQVAACTIGYGDLSKNDLLTADTDGLINILRSTEGVEVALLFKEVAPGQVKLSLRSKSFYNVNELAQEYEGGGHPRAAGCTIRGNVSDIVDEVLQKAEGALKGRGDNERSN